jgi:hypothetical protein
MGLAESDQGVQQKQKQKGKSKQTVHRHGFKVFN